MNSQITKLYEIGKKESRIIIGLMSGTSLDGLDIALCKIVGSGINSKVEILKFETLPYDDNFRNYVRTIFAKTMVNQQDLCGINPYIAQVHSTLINKALNDWQILPEDVDLIASHGQTVFHAPQSLTKNPNLPNSTLQLGDGDHIAVGTGIITISDFRQKHIAAGGEGAPLAAYGDYLLFTDTIENRILLNIGGISNFTFLPPQGSTQKAFATDLGPGNTMMNQYMHQYFGLEMDKNAEIAKTGTVDTTLLQALLADEFLTLSFPKTTGPELFNLAYLLKKQQETKKTDLSHSDIMATLNAFSATAIANGILEVSKELKNVAVYVSGGGLHNPLLLQNIKDRLPDYVVTSIDKIAMDPDAKEACLFAVLANETVAGNPETISGLKDSPMVCMGKISFPY